MPDGYSILVQVLGAFTRLILIAVGVAIPLAWWIMNQWLENFSYQVSIAPSVFLIAGAALVGIAWLTMGYFTYKALKLNPVDTLKSE